MTFSNFYENTNPIFIKLGILKLHDLVIYHNAIFIYDFYNDNFPETFNANCFSLLIKDTNIIATRLASRLSYSLYLVLELIKVNLIFVIACESVE